jgi:hypothetical protein
MQTLEMQDVRAVRPPQRLPKRSAKKNPAANGASRPRNRAPTWNPFAAYDQTVDKRPNPTDPQGPLFHILRVFLTDREARLRNIYSSCTLDSRLVLADAKTLLLEEAKVSKK